MKDKYITIMIMDNVEDVHAIVAALKHLVEFLIVNKLMQMEILQRFPVVLQYGVIIIVAVTMSHMQVKSFQEKLPLTINTIM